MHFLPFKTKYDVKRNCLGPIIHCVLQLHAVPGERWLFSLVSAVRPRYFPLLPKGPESIRLLDLKVTFSLPSLWSGYSDWVSSSFAPLVTQPCPLRKGLWKWQKENCKEREIVLNREKRGEKNILFLDAKLVESFHYAEPICYFTQWELSLNTAI